MKKFCLIISSILVVGCSSLPSVDTEVVDARKNELKLKFKSIEKEIAETLNNKPNATTLNYRQPINKKEKCLMPEADKFMDNSISIYWDGECKDGYVYGLGREIVKGPYTHVEEVTYHDVKNVNIFNNAALVWNRDYVLKNTRYILAYRNNYSLEKWVSIEDTGNFNIIELIGKFQPQFGVFYGKISSIYPRVITRFYNPFYYYQHVEENDPTKNVMVMGGAYESETNAPLGLENFGYRDGSVAVVYKGQKVQSPDNYWDDLVVRLTQAEQEYSKAENAYNQVQGMLQKYLYKACGNDPVPKGIPADLYKEICTWDLQFVDKINDVVAKNKAIMDQKIIQMNNERLIQAREAEAAAAQERARAEESKARAIKDLQNEIAEPKNTSCMNLGFGMVSCRTY